MLFARCQASTGGAVGVIKKSSSDKNYHIIEVSCQIREGVLEGFRWSPVCEEKINKLYKKQLDMRYLPFRLRSIFIVGTHIAYNKSESKAWERRYQKFLW